MDDDLTRLGIPVEFIGEAAHVRMHDTIEPFARLRIVENDLSQRTAIQVPVPYDGRPNACDLAQPVASGRHRFAR
jgi:hypothetical protein